MIDEPEPSVSDEQDVATRRLLFWLRVPYVADAGLVIIGVWLLLDGNGVGWWVLLFALLRAIIGTVSLLVIAPRMIAARRHPGGPGPR
ncbi:hypothetical protein ACFJGV_12055 [Cnuibacter sp. UC19_7]|uniref:hypothetical protein n=1 Tax=Cnuibacter sp. UC19_7 TaxID=3350166 RepID=UPI0036733FBB